MSYVLGLTISQILLNCKRVTKNSLAKKDQSHRLIIRQQRTPSLSAIRRATEVSTPNIYESLACQNLGYIHPYRELLSACFLHI